MAQGVTVGTVMTRRVVSVAMDESLRRVRELFNSVRFHHLVVVDDGRVVGVISDRDLLRHLSPFVDRVNERAQDAATLTKRAHQVMSRPVVTCEEGTPIGEAGRRMLDRRVTCLPVVDARGGCVGIVTMRDILAWSLVACAGQETSCPLPKAA
jgi:acetoin utilization protein AcuB